ncbi:MAG: hypothetical protein ACREF7_03810, partial [Candidatus Saccharimonadales bacterium]
DEVLLAQSINSEIRFTGDMMYDDYLAAARGLNSDVGFRKYMGKRFGESSRIVDYSEIGKGHLITDLNVKSITDSYITI